MKATRILKRTLLFFVIFAVLTMLDAMWTSRPFSFDDAFRLGVKVVLAALVFGLLSWLEVKWRDKN